MANDAQHAILTSSGTEFFAVLETELKAEIPQLIKNVLMFFEYNCAIVLARFDNGSINSLEDDLRNNFDADMLLEAERMENYLGRFVKCQRKFKFLDGQRKWFELIAETCRRFVGEIHPSLALGATTSGDVQITGNVENGNFIN